MADHEKRLAKEAFLRAIYEKMQSEADLSVAEGETLFERYVQEDLRRAGISAHDGDI